ncbi:hypothetical protein FRC09_018519 [Ceratobasidium sp. 395]|nr:hypothetical protein FRC09_018519 [Ceratobasidium sp. 395]
MPKAIPQSKVRSVLAGLDAGHTSTRIRADCDVSHGTISKLRAQHRPNLAKSVGGRPRKLSATAIRYATRLVTRRNAALSAVKATRVLVEIDGGKSVHPDTVRRALREAGVKRVKKVGAQVLGPRDRRRFIWTTR